MFSGPWATGMPSFFFLKWPLWPTEDSDPTRGDHGDEDNGGLGPVSENVGEEATNIRALLLLAG